MKKVLGIVTALTLAIVMVACGKPQHMSQESYDYASRALEIVEKYNKAEIDENDALSRLESIYNSVEQLTFSDDLEEITNESLTIILRSATFSLKHNAGDMIDTENSLKEYLGK